jgi:cation diffusion facilitator CzcD-associated flavoprotein CzcO
MNPLAALPFGAPEGWDGVVAAHADVVIIGAGFAGLGAAWLLDAAGFRDVTILERADEVGGTWRDNVYPGAACDVRSDLYSFSFAPNPAWLHRYARQREILDYLVTVSQRRGIRGRIRFGTELLEARWSGDEGRWRLGTSRGELTCRVLVAGAGPLVEPVWPTIQGLDTFAGPLLHTARWDAAVPLAGRRVGVIGTGASAAQVVPELAGTAGRTVVFQRTPPWVLRRHDRPTSARRRLLFRTVPAAQRLARSWALATSEARHLGFRHRLVGRVAELVALRTLAAAVQDPALRASLVPRYRIGCKRVLISDDYPAVLTRPGVALVPSRIERIEPGAVVTADGERHDLDVLVCATGFDATHPPVAARIVGSSGDTLAAGWSAGMSALRGTAVAGFPNLFLLLGPSTLLAHTGVVHVIESQARYLVAALSFQRRHGLGPLEARPRAQEAWTRRVQAAMVRTVWSWGGCTSFYQDEHGRTTTLWPGLAVGLRSALARFDAAEYRTC